MILSFSRKSYNRMLFVRGLGNRIATKVGNVSSSEIMINATTNLVSIIVSL